MKTLQIGKTYKDGQGYGYTIQPHAGEDCDLFPFKGFQSDGLTFDLFTEDGKFFSSKRESEYNLIIPDEPEQTTELTAEITKEEPKVKHLDVILAIVQGTPVQYDFTLTGTWHDYEHNTGMSPVDHPEYNWRIKPQPEPKRTVVIGKRTVVAPEVEAPAIGSEYWVMYCDYIEEWNNDSADFALLLEGRVFLDAKDGRTCQVAIQALLLGKD